MEIRPIKADITIEDLEKLDIRVGKIIEAEFIEGTELIKQQVDFGPEIGIKQIVSKIAKSYTPEDLINCLASYILNLPPRKLRGVESQGMIVGISVLGTKETRVAFAKATPGSIIF